MILLINEQVRIFTMKLLSFFTKNPITTVKRPSAYKSTKLTAYLHPKKELIGSTPKIELMVKAEKKTIRPICTGLMLILEFFLSQLPHKYKATDSRVNAVINRDLEVVKE